MTAAKEIASRAYKAREEGNLLEARALYAEAAEAYRDEGDLLGFAHATRHIADIYCQEGNDAPAKPMYEGALEVYRSSLHTKVLNLANTVRPYALLIEKEGQEAAAAELWEEARNLYQSLRLEAGVAECEKHLAGLQQ